MNCKPGDLAVIVSGPLNTGRLVNVLSASDCGPGWWYVESAAGLLSGVLDGSVRRFASRTGHIEDCRLRPIRDPGDDAVDESHAWLPPVPTHTKEPA